MRIDEALLQWTESCSQPLTVLRFYRWKVPTVSLGKHQRAEEAVEATYCRQQAIPIVHRPTGGRAVFHAHEVTYSLASNDSSIFSLGKISNTYNAIANALACGMDRLGIRAQLYKGRPRPPTEEGKRNPCFSSTARHELLFQERKLAGAAQRQQRRSFLQHGSIPLSVDYLQMALVLGVEPQQLRNSLISIGEASQKALGFGRVCQVLAEGFEQIFRVQLAAPVETESLPSFRGSGPQRQDLHPG